jgi:hypothetical protein
MPLEATPNPYFLISFLESSWKIAIFSVVMPCNLIEIDVGQVLQEYKAKLRRQASSYSLP